MNPLESQNSRESLMSFSNIYRGPQSNEKEHLQKTRSMNNLFIRQKSGESYIDDGKNRLLNTHKQSQDFFDPYFSKAKANQFRNNEGRKSAQALGVRVRESSIDD